MSANERDASEVLGRVKKELTVVAAAAVLGKSLPTRLAVQRRVTIPRTGGRI